MDNRSPPPPQSAELNAVATMAASAVLLLLAILALFPGSLTVPLAKANQCTAEHIRQYLTTVYKECGEDFVYYDCCQVS